VFAIKYEEVGINEHDMMQIIQNFGNYNPIRIIIYSRSSNIGSITQLSFYSSS
jgi:hypothetical protein